MELSTYLHYDGSCQEAFNLYKEVLGGKITFMLSYRDTPAADMVPEEWKDKVTHARLEIGDKVLLGCDSPPEYQAKPQGFAVTLFVDTPAEVERIYNALAAGGQVRMPLEKTFFAERFGMLTDRYGIPWMVGCMARDPRQA